VKQRILLAVGFALCGALLGVAGSLLGFPEDRRNEGHSSGTESAVVQAVDSLLARYRIEKGSVRTRQMTLSGGIAARVEQRFAAPSGFYGLAFNHALGVRLAPAGAHVVAIEHAKERTMTLHIVNKHAVVRSIVVTMPPPLPGKLPDAGM
jgi:hypothetical protein